MLSRELSLVIAERLVEDLDSIMSHTNIPVLPAQAEELVDIVQQGVDMSDKEWHNVEDFLEGGLFDRYQASLNHIAEQIAHKLYGKETVEAIGRKR